METISTRLIESKNVLEENIIHDSYLDFCLKYAISTNPYHNVPKEFSHHYVDCIKPFCTV